MMGRRLGDHSATVGIGGTVGLLAMAGLLAVAGCGGGDRTAAPAADAADGAAIGAATGAAMSALAGPGDLRGYNVVLVTLDTLRADRLGAYGHAGAATPNVDRLAAEGVRFERVTTTVPVTLPAHASIMTGRYPFAHGVRNNASFVLPDSAETLAESLAAAGYATGGFVGAVVLDAQFGIGQGFATYRGVDDDAGAAAGVSAAGAGAAADIAGPGSGERRAEAVIEQASSWVLSQLGPFFAWVHLYDPHDPYEPPEPYLTRFADDPYDGEIAYVDAMIGRLLEALAIRSRDEHTLIVITADHGEGLGEHGEQGHSFFVYESTIRVPLIYWAPGKLPAGAAVGGAASVVDIAPAILSWLGVAADPADTADRGAGVYAESLIPFLDFGWSELRALVDDGYKYIEAPRPELYDLSADPGETTNLVAAEPARAARMRAALQAMVGADDVATAGQGGVDDATLERLRSLGYIGGGGTATVDGQIDPEDKIDPKDKITVYEQFVDGLVDAVDAIAEQRFGDANETLVGLDELMPDNYIVHYYFGRLAYEAGDPPTAVGVLRRALELNPRYLPTYTQLADALFGAGDAVAAQELLAEASVLFPDNFDLRFLSGAFYHDTGQLDAALAAYRDAELLRPADPRLLERLGHLFLLRRQPAEAVTALRALSRARPDNAAVWAQLAFGLAIEGRAEEAQRALQRALAIDPNDPTVLQVMAQLR